MIEGERMLIRHKDYLTFEMPNTWVIEEGNEATSIYDNNGEGALTLSFYTIMELQKMCIRDRRDAVPAGGRRH